MKRAWRESDHHSEGSSGDEMSFSSASVSKCLCLPQHSSHDTASRAGAGTSILSALPSGRHSPPELSETTDLLYNEAGSGNASTGDASNPALVDGEKLLVNELTNMSLQERESMMNEIHGVPMAMKETVDLKDHGLKMLASNITKVPNNRKEMYNRVSFLAPKVARDPELRLLYLRSSEWDPQKAAERYCKHFQMKYQLFGMTKIAHTIHWEDLPPDAQASLLSGSFYMNEKFKDRAGRIIVFNSPSQWRYNSLLSHVQAMWFYNFSYRYTVQTQCKGVIIVANFFDAPRSCFNDSVQMAKYDFLDTMPIRVAGLHYMFPNTQLRPIFSFLLSVMPSNFRMRTKVHFGSMMECGYSLASYGISFSVLPIDENGTFQSSLIDKTVQEVRQHSKQIEADYLSSLPGNDHGDGNGSSSCNCDGTADSHPDGTSNGQGNGDGTKSNHNHGRNDDDLPVVWSVRTTDLLIGRGTPYQKHEGNIQFRFWVQQSIMEFEQQQNCQPSSEQLVQMLQQTRGIRFLKKHAEDWWIEVPNDVAKARVAMCRRSLAKK